MGQATADISWISVISAGLWHSVNPASFLGCLLFVFLAARFQKVCQLGKVFGAVVIFVCFPVQILLHMGLSDPFYTHMPWFILSLDILRIVLAILVLAAGARLFHQAFIKGAPAVDALTKTFYMFPPLKHESLRTWLKWPGIVLRGLFWGLVLAVFCGIWPLENTALYVLYEIGQKWNRMLFWKLVVYEACAMVLFFGTLFMVDMLARRSALRKSVLDSRMIVIALSGICIAAGCGTIIHYVTKWI